MVKITPTVIDKWWKAFDIGTLNIASTKYQAAKRKYKAARRSGLKSEYEEAEKKYKIFLDMVKIDTNAFIEYSEILQFLKKPNEAIDALTIALKRRGDRPDFLIRDQSFLNSKLFVLYAEKKDYEKALQHLRDIKKEKYEEIRPLIDLIANSQKSYKDKIQKIFDEKDSRYKIRNTELEEFKKKSLSYASEESIDQYKLKIMFFLHCFNGALAGTIKSKITYNTNTTNEVLTELHKGGFIRYERIFNYDVFFLDDAGKRIVEIVNEELFSKSKGYTVKDAEVIASDFEMELFDKLSEWTKLKEKEKEKEWNPDFKNKG
jgi:hypothetical protein